MGGVDDGPEEVKVSRGEVAGGKLRGSRPGALKTGGGGGGEGEELTQEDGGDVLPGAGSQQSWWVVSHLCS